MQWKCWAFKRGFFWAAQFSENRIIVVKLQIWIRIVPQKTKIKKISLHTGSFSIKFQKNYPVFPKWHFFHFFSLCVAAMHVVDFFFSSRNDYNDVHFSYKIIVAEDLVMNWFLWAKYSRSLHRVEECSEKKHPVQIHIIEDQNCILKSYTVQGLIVK